MEIGKVKDWEVEIGRVELLMVNRSVVAQRISSPTEAASHRIGVTTPRLRMRRAPLTALNYIICVHIWSQCVIYLHRKSSVDYHPYKNSMEMFYFCMLLTITRSQYKGLRMCTQMI